MLFDRIDRYVARQFALTFAFSIAAFVIIYVAVDLMEHMDDFLDRDVPTPVIVQYYMYAAPDILHLVVPIAVLLASLFTVGRLDTSNELTAIRSAGRSMRRFAIPLLLMGLLVSFAMVAFDGWIVPEANKRRFGIDRQYLGGSLGGSLIGGQRNVQLRLSPRVSMLIDYFDPATGEATQVSIERYDSAAAIVTARVERSGRAENQVVVDTSRGLRIIERIDAARMVYDSTRNVWILRDGVARNFSDPTEINATPFAEREAPPMPLRPQELNLTQRKPEELSNNEMLARIEQEELGGRDIAGLLVDYYARFSFPFSAVIVVFFGIPFSSTQRKSGAAVRVAITALVSAIYLILTEVTKAFTYNGDLPPLVTAWLANGAFLLVGLFNLWRIERR